jgi:hypothetical protein
MGNAKELSAALVTLTLATSAPGCGGKRVSVPLDHRDAGVSCPQQRASSLPDGGGGRRCERDSDCDAGLNGRCGWFAFGGFIVCAYDECFNDSDCGGRVPCECRASASSTDPNVCLTGSNCSVDSDCGPGGYCSPSLEGISTAYYCHTPDDTCANDSDCPMNQPTCAFDTSSGHWACALFQPPP